MSASMAFLRQLTDDLDRSISEAEHMPGSWRTSLSRMGGISTVPADGKIGMDSLLSSEAEESWAGFSYKRDGWLAVAVVNALPSLLAIANGVAELVEHEPKRPNAALKSLLAASQVELRAGSSASTDGATASRESLGAQMIVHERLRQQAVKGWTAEHDDDREDESMAMVCALYAAPVPVFELQQHGQSFHFVDPWPRSWDGEWDKRRVDADGKPRERLVDEKIEDLVKAGALAAAEIDRLLRSIQDGQSVGIEVQGDRHG